MFRPKNLSSLAIFVVTIALLFSGCSSTDSNNDGSNSNNDDNNPPQVNFQSTTLAPGDMYSFTFEDEGEVEYYCNIHAPDMQGKITVSSSAEAVEKDTVTMEGTSFNPSELTVAPNTEVVWVNEANVDHTVYSGNPSSDNGGNPNY